MDFEHSFVKRTCLHAGEVSLHMVSCGPKEAPRLLFVHGFPEFWYGWIHQLHEFSKDFRCHAIDLRGFNRSSQPSDVAAYKPALILDDLRAVIAQVGGTLEALIAHDWGGAIAWSLAAQSPKLMRKFVIANSPHSMCFAHALVHDAEQIEASQYMNWLCNSGAETVLAENNFQRLVAMASLKAEDQRALYRECWSRGLTGGLNYYRVSPLKPDTPTTQGHAAKLLAALKPENFRVDVPTQLIWGTADVALRPMLLKDIESHVRNLRIDRIDGAGHWLLREQPSAVNRLIREFLAT